MAHEAQVLVGMDGSEPSELALRWAVSEAQWRGWSLRIVSAYSVTSYATALDFGFTALDDTAMRQATQQILDEAVAYATRARVPVTSHLEYGDPGAALIAESERAGLVVVGTRGGGGFTERLLGTVSSTVPAHSTCPVVVVPKLTPDATACIPPRRIVVGADGSPSAEIALEFAIEEAALWGAELTVVIGVPMAHRTSSAPWLPGAMDRADVLDDVAVRARASVTALVRGRDIEVKVSALDGSGAALLAEFSTAVDLVVVGSRGRGGFTGMLLGSTSQSVLRHAACPVMVVPVRVAEEEGISPSDPPWRRPEPEDPPEALA